MVMLFAPLKYIPTPSAVLIFLPLKVFSEYKLHCTTFFSILNIVGITVGVTLTIPALFAIDTTNSSGVIPLFANAYCCSDVRMPSCVTSSVE
jgi:hypothetical protein